MKHSESNIQEKVNKEIENFGTQVSLYKNKEIPEEKFKRYRLQNGIYGQRQPGSQMVRVKIPTGLLNAKQLRCLADIAENYATGIGHVTTRQDIQFHYVDIGNVTELMSTLSSAGLTTREACGNTVRNVTSCHLAGVCPTELFDVSEIGEKVAYHLLWNRINQDLPRKFKISFSGCTSECGLAAIHDIGFVAASREENGKTVCGFKVFVGGGLGSHPKLAQRYTDFLPIDEVLPFCEAILKLFDTHGNRRNKSKARMKFILENWGMDKFKEEMARILAEIKDIGQTFPDLPQPVLKETPPPLPIIQGGNGAELNGDAFKLWSLTNIFPQANGTCAIQIKLRLGDVTAAQFRGLADILERFSTKDVRTTHQQNIILQQVTNEQIPALYRALNEMGLADAGAERVVDVIACPGADTCQLALTNSMGVGGAIIDKFASELDSYDDLKGVRVRISGCPNSCGHHHIAGIGLHGVAKRINGKLVPHYQLHLGGGVNADEAVIGKSKIKLPAKNIPSAIMALIGLYREKREEGEAFNDFINRYGRDAIGKKLSEFADLPPVDEAPSLYRDWKEEDKDFSLDDLGPGECSGTVIDMIEHGLRRAVESITKATRTFDRAQYSEAVDLIKEAILFDARSLLYTFGTDSPHDDQILKEFQQKLVEHAIISERFEFFTEDLGNWADFGDDAEAVRPYLDQGVVFVQECQEAYDRIDSKMKFRKAENV
ncbi:nitrite/sulfite reductase [Nitrospira defluvii]|nr:nitrite/sulfite reductase [Nitrospira defluvii]